MSKVILLFFGCLIIFRAYPQSDVALKSGIHIIPQPVSLSIKTGGFIPNKNTLVLFDKKASGEADFITQAFFNLTGYHLRAKEIAATPQRFANSNRILLVLNSEINSALGDEGYAMNVTSQKITIAANKRQGLFYGIQTLIQLLPPDANIKHSETKNLTIPCLDITDYPRFGYRGLMLDVSRHFFPKEFVEKYINEMAKYKLNVFHWHLTDDNGWRIEIKGLPALTKTGAWRVARTGVWRLFQPPQPGEETPYGGYYSQNDIRDIVTYAKKRFITIIPEIDVPGHSLSLIASYPNLSCTQLSYAVNPGSAFYKKDDNVLCVNNDSTWMILDSVFTQVAELFPGPYIHIGGDEAYKGFWEHCPKDLALMKKEGLNNSDELQSFFVKKLEKMIVSKGKKIIGWDEILEGGLAPEAIVMSWRGTKGGTDAAGMGHEVIMTPINSTYLSRKQSDAATEPYAPGMVRLSTCYNFDPVPDSVDARKILGGQASLWTEFVPTERHAEYMTWPRAMAISEVLWSPKTNRNWPDFVRRVEKQFKYLDADTIKYSEGIYDPVATAVKLNGDSIKIALTTDFPGLDLYYTFDGTIPDTLYMKYKGAPLDIPKGATAIRAMSYRHGRIVGKLVECTLDDLKKKAGY